MHQYLSTLLLWLLPFHVASFGSEGSTRYRCDARLKQVSGSRTPILLDAAVVSSNDDNHPEFMRDEPNVELSSRRNVLLQMGTLATMSGLWMVPRANAVTASPQVGASPSGPVAILGASGKTGMEVAQALAKEGIFVVTMTRSGKDPFQVVKLKPETLNYIQHFPDPVNVASKESIQQALEQVHATGIIFCASASAKGGNAFEVDDEGAGNAAEAALKLHARLVLVSALAVDRPHSKSYQVTNTLGGNLNGIMDAKLQGENKVRSILSKDKNYVIIRPGVLMNGKTRNGAMDIELNQGDTIGGGMSRDELAGVIVGGLLSAKRGVTVEVYRRATATKLQPGFSLPSGREHIADTFSGLFTSADPDD